MVVQALGGWESGSKMVRCIQSRKNASDPCVCGHHLSVLNDDENKRLIEEEARNTRAFAEQMQQLATQFCPEQPLQGQISNKELQKKYRKVVDPLAKWYTGDSSLPAKVTNRAKEIFERSQTIGKSGDSIMAELLAGRYFADNDRCLVTPRVDHQYPGQWRSRDHHQKIDPDGQPEVWSILSHNHMGSPAYNDREEKMRKRTTFMRQNKKLVRQLSHSMALQKRSQSVPLMESPSSTLTSFASSSPSQKTVVTAGISTSQNFAALQPQKVLDLIQLVSSVSPSKNKQNAQREALMAFRDIGELDATKPRISREHSMRSTQSLKPLGSTDMSSRPRMPVNRLNLTENQKKFNASMREAVLAKHTTVQNAFRWLDTTSSGVITLDDIRRSCQFFGIRPSQSQLEGFMAEIDINGDGVCSFHEFATALGHSALEERDYFQVASRGCFGPCNERIEFHTAESLRNAKSSQQLPPLPK